MEVDSQELGSPKAREHLHLSSWVHTLTLASGESNPYVGQWGDGGGDSRTKCCNFLVSSLLSKVLLILFFTFIYF